MLTSTILSFILALQLLTTYTKNISALPITSKPIEGTAEHLAWQAWLMLPPEQKNLEKSRKVTPKSIFTLPNRECPAGHKLFEDRCIPMLNIDPEALVTQQLLGYVVNDNNSDDNYDFDFDDIGSDEIIDVMYNPAEKLSSNDYNKDTYQYDQLSSQDEPLKFDIFQKKFPTDYEGESKPNDESVELTAKVNANTSMAEAINDLTAKEPKLNITQSKNNSIIDLQMESSNISMNIAENISNNSKNTDDIVTTSTPFSISDIDAIVLSAVPTLNSNLESNKQNTHNIHKISLFKDDSSVQLITSSLLTQHDNEPKKQPDLKELLKADNLLPLPNITAQRLTSNTDNVGSLKTVTSPRISSILSDNEVSTLSTLFSTGVNATTPLSGSSTVELTEVTDMMLSDAETTLPTLLDDLPDEDEKVVTPAELSGYINSKKEERPRSVIMQNETSELTEAQEEKFTTTTEPDVTTNFQVDETTIDEVHDAPTIALKELLELAQHPSVENLGVVVKKSKVEPVELPPIVFSETETETDTNETPTSMRSEETTTSATNLLVTKVAEMSTSTSSMLLPTISMLSSTKVDRFNKQHSDNSMKPEMNDEHFKDSNLKNIETLKPTIQAASEIDIKQELRMINELVKGNNNKNKGKQQIKGGIIKSVTTNKAESGLTTIFKNPTKANAFGNKDEIDESLIQDSTSNKEESRTTVAMNKSTSTPTTTSTTTSTTTLSTKSSTKPSMELKTTIWSKIMPFLGFSSSFGETTTETTETTPIHIASSSTESTNSKSVIINSSNNNKHVESSINRSNNKNSKIIKINSLSTPSYSSSSSTSSSSSGISSSSSRSIISSDSSSSNNFFADKLVPSTTEHSTTTTTEIYDSSTTIESDPFWWIPLGWRLDHSNDNDGNIDDGNAESVDEPSLLIRLWSSFPEIDDTSKLRK